MRNRKVKELMSEQPCTIAPDATLQEAAKMMANVDCGFLPVCSKSDVIGIITDRDIVIRAVSRGKDPTKEKVLNYMTNECFGCHENDYLEDAATKMHDHKVSRLIVRDSKGQVSGVLSFGGILRKNADAKEVTNVVKHATRREVA
jgi:predicted transcriptional regulator